MPIKQEKITKLSKNQPNYKSNISNIERTKPFQKTLIFSMKH